MQSLEREEAMIDLGIWIPMDKREKAEHLTSLFQIRHFQNA